MHDPILYEKPGWADDNAKQRKNAEAIAMLAAGYGKVTYEKPGWRQKNWIGMRFPGTDQGFYFCPEDLEGEKEPCPVADSLEKLFEQYKKKEERKTQDSTSPKP
jgi:hypothetical protein